MESDIVTHLRSISFFYFFFFFNTLIYLRYLKIKYAYIEGDIPASIGNLTNLETLELISDHSKFLPESIMKLLRFRNLCGTLSLPNYLDTALLVETLDSQIVRLIVEGKLPNINRLG